MPAPQDQNHSHLHYISLRFITVEQLIVHPKNDKRIRMLGYFRPFSTAGVIRSYHKDNTTEHRRTLIGYSYFLLYSVDKTHRVDISYDELCVATMLEEKEIENEGTISISFHYACILYVFSHF